MVFEFDAATLLVPSNGTYGHFVAGLQSGRVLVGAPDVVPVAYLDVEDIDGDGVGICDLCPGTPPETPVDANGCP